jgi:murein DD-endopeptidase MepM/ murein hydrolase activator NlpD
VKHLKLILLIISAANAAFTQNKQGWLKGMFSPTPTEQSVIHPKLDTTSAVFSDTTDVFLAKHFSEDIDESGVDLVDEQLYYLDSKGIKHLKKSTTVTVAPKKEVVFGNVPPNPLDDDDQLLEDDNEEGDDTDESDSSSTKINGFYISNIEEWLKVDSLYRIFNPYVVNPYHFNPAAIKDTLHFTMYDKLRKWSMPLDITHYITSVYGPRGSSYHYGTDLRLDIGDTIRSVFDGIVRISKYNPNGYGNYVLVRHYNGTETIYGHMSERSVAVGQEVKAGAVLGLGGNTGRSSGPHLHFEVRYRGIAVNPQLFFDFGNNRILKDKVNLAPKEFYKVRVQRSKVYHRVKRGDTLYSISKRYGVKASTVAKLNRISTRSSIKVGQTLRVK